MSDSHFIDLGERDPLRYAFGLPWYARKPLSLGPDEMRSLRSAVKQGIVSLSEYLDWEENVR